MPSTGSKVVKGYAATFGCARVSRDSSDDLPAFGRPDEPDVGEQLQVQLDIALLARQAFLGEPRRLSHGGREALVAASAGPATRQRDLLPRPDEVEGAPVPALDLRPRRHRHDQRVAVGPVLQRAQAVPAAIGAVMATPAEGLQVAQRVVAAQDHVAAAAAIAAVGATLRYMGLAPEGQRTIAAAPGPDLDSRAIGQHFAG